MKRSFAWLWLPIACVVSFIPVHAREVKLSPWQHVWQGVIALCVLHHAQAQPQAWIDTLGGTNPDFCHDLVVDDAGFGLTGTLYSYGAGNADVMFSRYDDEGELQSVYALGSSYDDEGFAIEQVGDAFVVAGYTKGREMGDADFLLTKFDSTGIYWSKAFGGLDEDQAYAMALTPDDGFVAVGYTRSGGAGGADWLIVKFSATGSWSWSKTFGGSGDEYAYKVVVTAMGDLIILGSTTSTGAGGKNLLIASFSYAGDPLWSYTLGGVQDEAGYGLALAEDGTIFLGGETSSYGIGDVNILLASLTPAGHPIWIKTFGGTNVDRVRDLVLDGDVLALIGDTASFGAGLVDVLLATFNHSGDLIKSKVIGGGEDDHGYALALTPAGQWAAVGTTQSYGGIHDNILFAQLTHEDVDCGSFVTPTVLNVTGNVSWSNASLTMSSFVGHVEDMSFTFSPVVLDANRVCNIPMATTSLPETTAMLTTTLLSSQMQYFTSTLVQSTNQTYHSKSDSVPWTEDSLVWGIVGVSLGCFGIMLSIACWSAFWKTFFSEKKEIQEETQEAIKENKPPPEKPDIQFFIGDNMEQEMKNMSSDLTMKISEKNPKISYYT